jgi:hypothetical protein
MVNANLESNLRQVNWLLPDVRFGGDLPFAGGSPGRAKIYVRHQSTAIDPDWVLVGVKASIEMVDARNNFQPDEDLEDPNGLARMSVLAPPQQFARSFVKVHIRDRFLTLKVGEHPTMRRDPSLRMRWSVIVHKPDGTASEIAPVDQWSDQAGSRTLALDLWEPEVYVATRLDIRLDYYRPPFDPATVVFSDSREGIPILDRFRRDLPFVRWVTSVSWSVEVDGEMVTESKLRKSAVHKTDVHERCKFCDTGSEVGDTYDYFETLPPVERSDMRTQLCHYCFQLPTR